MTWISEKIVVVPVDMSDFSLNALQTACELVEHHEQIKILHVLPPLEPIEAGIAWNASSDGVRTEQTRAAVSAFLSDRGYSNFKITVRVGDSGTQIPLFAEDVQADLIVIASHGRGMFKRLLLGSTTDRVVHLAPCPVLVLKDKKITKK
ncbi:MAG: universal stress protein [Thermoguttaceae bacterium]